MGARIVITGAAGGIGRAAAAALRARGARVVGLDLHPEGEEILACDVRDQASVDVAVAAAVERLGGLDVLVNNAGLGIPQSAVAAPDAAALSVLDVNLVGAWRVTAAAMPALRRSRGRVVNVASGLAFVTLPYAPAYCASKRALVAYSDALRLECGEAITVTTVYPGYVRTGIHRAAAERGLSLEGLVPTESLEAAATTIVRAALGRPRRDLATTRRGAVAHAVCRHLPPAALDALVRARLRWAERRGLVDGRRLSAPATPASPPGARGEVTAP